MERIYPVNFCLDNESDFEDYHPRFNSEKNELLLDINEVLSLIDRCVNPNDNVGVSFPSETKGKWNVLEIHGVDGCLYTLEYQIGRAGGSFYKKNVSKVEVHSVLTDIEGPISAFDKHGYEFVQW